MLREKRTREAQLYEVRAQKQQEKQTKKEYEASLLNEIKQKQEEEKKKAY